MTGLMLFTTTSCVAKVVLPEASVASQLTVVVPAKNGSVSDGLRSERPANTTLEEGQLSNRPPLSEVGAVTVTVDLQSPPLVLVGGTWIGVITGGSLSEIVTRNVLVLLPHTLLETTVTLVL